MNQPRSLLPPLVFIEAPEGNRHTYEAMHIDELIYDLLGAISEGSMILADLMLDEMLYPDNVGPIHDDSR